MDNCSDCKNCVHLVSDSHLLKKEKLFSQLVCAFCWVPLINSTQSTLENSSVVTECGHVHISPTLFGTPNTTAARHTTSMSNGWSHNTNC